MVTAFSDEVGGSGGRRVLRGSREGEEARLNNPQRKAARGGGGLRAPLTVEEFTTAEAAGQWRWRAWTATWLSSDTGDSTVGTVPCEARRRHGSDSGETLSERHC
jgi:hypothetical protein